MAVGAPPAPAALSARGIVKSFGGRRVLGGLDAVPGLVEALGIRQLLFAIPRLPAARVREVLAACARFKLNYKILPVSFAYLNDRVSVSMLQDLDAGRETEVDVVNGGVAGKGRELGIPTPCNDAVVELVHSMERGERKSEPRWLRYVSDAQTIRATDS